MILKIKFYSKQNILLLKKIDKCMMSIYVDLILKIIWIFNLKIKRNRINRKI